MRGGARRLPTNLGPSPLCRVPGSPPSRALSLSLPSPSLAVSLAGLRPPRGPGLSRGVATSPGPDPPAIPPLVVMSQFGLYLSITSLSLRFGDDSVRSLSTSLSLSSER